MSNLASSAVSLYPSVANGGLSAAEHVIGRVGLGLLVRNLVLVLTGQGGATNKITAESLGFSKLLSAGNLWDATNSKGYPAVVDPVNNILILLDGAAAPAPVDVTSSAAYITVTGIRLLQATARS